MPCKCLTGCINKKCSCRAKGMDCTDECAYCKKDDSKYECFNLPGKVPPILLKSKSNANSPSNSNSNSRKNSRNNSKIIEISDDSETETEALVKKASKELIQPKNEQDNNKTSQQTVIINNYYYNEYKQQNNAFTQVNHNYELAENDNYNRNHTQPNIVNNLIKNSNNNDSNTANNTPSSTIPKLTESLAGDFLKFYWECLSDKNKTKYLEKYICPMAELKIQEVPFIGAGVITKRLEEAAPIKINTFQYKIFPIDNTSYYKLYFILILIINFIYINLIISILTSYIYINKN
ncbi:hypothetical protein H8356DRAFT_1074496 [Neocallimastix lanati (nom. inval.)]|nr:hypothetical protein H8356DRAFT_1074496 [Neocallimastix sp. JGI-2020a]